MEMNLLDFLVPVRITLFDAESIDGPVTSINNSKLFSGIHDGSVDWNARLVGNMKLPSQLTDKTHSQGQHL